MNLYLFPITTTHMSMSSIPRDPAHSAVLEPHITVTNDSAVACISFHSLSTHSPPQCHTTSHDQTNVTTLPSHPNTTHSPSDPTGEPPQWRHRGARKSLSSAVTSSAVSGSLERRTQHMWICTRHGRRHSPDPQKCDVWQGLLLWLWGCGSSLGWRVRFTYLGEWADGGVGVLGKVLTSCDGLCFVGLEGMAGFFGCAKVLGLWLLLVEDLLFGFEV
ncbi:hypothetical protein P153DRAFT_187244 [Dothidotthia symphoricarpi CBS 119687]|uniref:Uncharacterized protein n=1 Tax=Dothidotthia symphoricarpi CBS 119687 TaxID=1392245 RepID=A0A6A6AMS7_9PLEO|nr:uncharacterized protein P153DRAFT_187244 [Dothidotthia symphoricarpi CBS 119687]KAF2132234.1 hypothetical protein P153DRAFT_187244 [Dothidotthia symphoricarpi CBS 119687]